jgi:predicted dehydrogenase
VQGDTGEIRVINPYHPHWFHWMTIRTPKNTWRGRIPGDNVYTLQLRAFASAIQSGTPLNTNPNDAVNTMRVIDAIYEKAGLKLRGAAQ